MKIDKKILLLLVFTMVGCVQAPESMVPFLEGYWEINDVKKNGKMFKEFTINTQVDYFEVHDDGSGFRKKVNPTVEGTYLITQHQTKFVLKIVKDELQIHYSDNEVNYFETIVKLNKETLIIKNKDGFVYTYKPFEALDIDL